ncbi:Fe-S cluster assembly protein SufD [Marivibrio halodurans]|uniref:Fe-S cluster assembly protein SufD n=1 Tax=Marivibrio halodurans TaxID=2039722 RepID=A0A8J7V222_9PROT|nr:Fe-S cluster assembly protein SufD [Marivibrio halodurans]MBP5856935.1 Fe-S cluster assembly protein SufD [Marivibrio halodurans]
MSDARTRQDPFQDALDARATRADAIAPLRERAAEAYRDAGLPTRRVERWKFTDLKGLAKLGFAPAAETPAPDALPETVADVEAVRLTLVNGRVAPGLSDLDRLPKGVTVRRLADVLEARDGSSDEAGEGASARLSVDAGFTDAPMAALNTAFVEDGWLIDIADGAMVDAPLHLVFLSANDTGNDTGNDAGNDAAGSAVASYPRLSLHVGRDAHVTIVESHVGQGGGPTFADGVSEIALERGAVLRHPVMQNEEAGAYHVHSTALTIAEGARYDGFVLQLGAALARREVRAELTGPKAEAHVNGAYLGDGARVVDNTLFVDHAAPETVSRETFKGVLDGTSRGVFQAKTLVRPIAQKTDGQQLHKALLLADGAEVDAKPELEIYADDVACSHGATSGDLDRDQLFYLRARGIPEKRARAMLIEAFMIDSLNAIGHEGAREAFREALAARLNRMEGIVG